MTSINASTPLLAAKSAFAATPRSFFGCVSQKCRRFTRLTSQITVLALDTLFCAAKFSTNIPPLVSKISLTALSFVGLIAVPYNVHYLIKSGKDALFALHAKNKLIALLAGSKVLETTSNLVLTCTGFAAAVEGLLGNTLTQAQLYQSMVAWGIATVALGTLNTISSMAINAQTLKTLQSTEGFEQSIHWLEALEAAPPTTALSSPAAQLRFCMDKDTLEKLLEALESIRSQELPELMQIIKENIQTQQRLNLGPQLVLVLIGDGLMIVEKYYTPNSVESAVIDLSVASAYTLKMILETIKEVRQRQRIEQAQASEA